VNHGGRRQGWEKSLKRVIVPPASDAARAEQEPLLPSSPPSTLEESIVPILTGDQVNGLDINVDELELSTRASNVLKTARIQTVRDLVGYAPQELMRTKFCGKKTLKEIKTIVEELGFRLGMELPSEKISGVSLVELAVAFATRGGAVCTYTDPRDGRETQNFSLVVYSIKRQGCYGDSNRRYNVGAELMFPGGNVPITVIYNEEAKEGIVKRQQPESVQ